MVLTGIIGEFFLDTLEIVRLEKVKENLAVIAVQSNMLSQSIN